jgi:hypothetical protein
MTQTQLSTTIKPTRWAANGARWGGLPVLAFPMVHGWALWEAIRERIFRIYEDPSPFMPADVLPILSEFDPLRDYKTMEMTMHKALRWALPRYYDLLTPGFPYWTVERAMAAVGDTEEYLPCPYYLSAKWLWQSYKFVNVMQLPPFLISISFIDEAEPVYTATDATYNTDKTAFEENVAATTALFHVRRPDGTYQSVIGSSGMPANVRYYQCSRDGDDYDTDLATLKAAFQLLGTQYRLTTGSAATPITLGIFVDASGSMGYDTVASIIAGLVAWVNANYELQGVEVRQAGDERWLHWTASYISELVPFAFSANVRKDLEEG